MKMPQILALILGLLLMVFGFSYPVPEKYVYVSSSSSAYDADWSENQGAEYIGGDAYNYQIEATLKAGYMSGILTMKVISIASGLLLFYAGLLSHVKCSCIEQQTAQLTELAKKTDTQIQILAEISVKTDTQSLLLQKYLDKMNHQSSIPDNTSSNVIQEKHEAESDNTNDNKAENTANEPVDVVEKAPEKTRRRFRPTVDPDGNWNCTHCGTKNDPDVSFCVSCMKDR